MIEYEPISWVNGEEAETTPLNADNLNHMDEGIQAATNYVSETRDIADNTAARLALQEARLDVIVANMTTNTRTLTQAEYDSLTEAEKNNNTIYFISDGGMNATTQAASVEYDNDRSGLTGETVQAAIDENASAVAALNSRTDRYLVRGTVNVAVSLTANGTYTNDSLDISSAVPTGYNPIALYVRATGSNALYVYQADIANIANRTAVLQLKNTSTGTVSATAVLIVLSVKA